MPHHSESPVTRDYDYYIAEAKKAELRSQLLWRAINQCIRSVLETQKSRGTPLSEIPGILRHIAGRKKRNEPVSIGNLRVAAKQIEKGWEFSVL